MTSRFFHSSLRRVLAATSAATLAGLGLVAATTPANASVQSVSVAASIDGGGSATVGYATTVNFAVTNQSPSSNLTSFTIVLPPGVSAPVGKTTPQALGVSGGGNWSETVTSCGSVPNCSWLLVAKGLLPRATSLVRPGQTLTASVSLVPTAVGTLQFGVINIENGTFTTSSTPSINVTSTAAGSFCVTPSTTSVQAGQPITFGIQAIQVGTGVGNPCSGTPVGYSAHNVLLHLTTDDGATGSLRIAPSATPPATDGSVSLVSSTTNSSATFAFGTSTSGHYTVVVTPQTAAGAQSLSVQELDASNTLTGVDGDSGAFAVTPGPAVNVVLESVADHANPSLGTSLTAGAQFDARFYVTDQFNNPTYSTSGQVTLNVGGPGVFTPLAPSDATTPTADGGISGSYDQAGTSVPITLTLGIAAGGTATSNAINVNFASTNIGSVFLVPGGSAALQTSNYVAPSNGIPNCALDATNPACANAIFSNGGNGAATIALEDCTTAGVPSQYCGGTTPDTRAIVVQILADLTDGHGNLLYGDGLNGNPKPAEYNYVCANEKCPWTKDTDDTSIGNSWEERVENYNLFPYYGADSKTPDTWYKVPACQTLPSDPENSTAPSGPATSVPAGTKQCVDVYSLVRNSSGDLSYRILYDDDTKGLPTG